MAEGGETFSEWLEQLELVATACRWDEPTKLVNLVTRLKGQAFLFYRSCDTTWRNQYSALVGELKKRFTPARIQAVQSSMFHDRKQKTGETVGAYAQELKRLQVSAETQSMGKLVLTSQFVAGLQSELKSKLAGKDGGFEQLLAQARFEEAKIRELRGPHHDSGPRGPPKKNDGMTSRTLPRQEGANQTTDSSSSMSGRCFACGKKGHRAAECLKRKHREGEASGHNRKEQTPKGKEKSVFALTPGGKQEASEMEKGEATTSRSRSRSGIADVSNNAWSHVGCVRF